LLTLLLGAQRLQACDYWVAPTPAGSDANPGSMAQPSGCGGGNFCPADANSRGQMAVFLTKTFELP
jgi:hypothetical protein